MPDNRHPEKVYIGKGVWLTRDVKILARSYCGNIQKNNFGVCEKIAQVVIEDGVFIGTGSIILPGVTLGRGCYIGAGSVVTKSISSGMIACGNPCRVIKGLMQ